MSIKAKLAAACAVASLGVTACSGSGTNPIAPTQDKLSTDVLTFAVGTANIFGDLGGAAAGSATGLNFVAAFRQPSTGLAPGDSAVLVSSPKITLPFNLTGTPVTTANTFDSTATILQGFAPGEAGGDAITSTPQGGSALTSFGVSGGVFGLGIERFNYGESGAPDSTLPYLLPLYDPLYGNDPNEDLGTGGVPAFDLAGNGQSVVGSSSEPADTFGVSEGIDVFEGLRPTVGTYKLAVSVPNDVSSPTFTKAATLNSAALLPAITPPTVVLDGTGGGTFTVTFPAGVTEAYVNITDIGPAQNAAGTLVGCNGATGLTGTPILYTVEVTPASPTGTLGDAAGPGGTPSICGPAANTTASGTAAPGDSVIVQTVGFDYPLYEASYRNSSVKGAPSPTLTGANGQSDITMSSAGALIGTSVASKPQITRNHFVLRSKATSRFL